MTDETVPTVKGVQGVLGLLPDGQAEAIAAVRAARDEARRWQCFQWELLAHVADLCGSLEGDQRYRLPGMERLVRLGHDGTPKVAEFMMDELAAALGMGVEVADAQVEFVLDCRHRLPKVWRALLEGRVTQWVAHDLVAATRDLSLADCLKVDALVGPKCGVMSRSRLVSMAKGLSGVHATLDRLDGKMLEASVDWIARILAQGGRDESEDARRAMALGILSTPARALQLMQASLTDEVDELPLAEPGEDDCPRRGQVGHTCGAVTVDPRRLLPKAEVVVHLTDETLADGRGLVRCEGLGPLLAGQLSTLLDGRAVALRPVIDLNQQVASDAYECPAWMRRAVELRSPRVCWPWSNRRSSGQGIDMDHVVPFKADGTPGQTRVDNLAPLTRRAHRVKTHGGWTVQQVAGGVVVWTSRLGAVYAVTPDGTHELRSPFVMSREVIRGLMTSSG